jgi:hypothetical protein
MRMLASSENPPGVRPTAHVGGRFVVEEAFCREDIEDPPTDRFL